jgi:hypothetical protein
VHRAAPRRKAPVTFTLDRNMDDELVQALKRTIEGCATREELEPRIVQSFGPAKLNQALLLAAEMKGLEWMRPNHRLEVADLMDHSRGRAGLAVRIWFGALLRLPSLIVVLSGSIGVALAMLFPPHVVHFQQGFIQNAGFAAIWNPPQYGTLYAAVNTPLLAVLIAGIAIVTCGLSWVCSRIEQSVRGAGAAP